MEKRSETNGKLLSGDYKSFLKEITEKIRKSQYEAMRTLNSALICLYWDIGKEIYEQQQQKGWGKSIVQVLAGELKKEFPEARGFSSRNLWNMRNFYVTYQADEKLQPMVAEISWTKNVVIMEKCKEDIEREFYIRMTKRYGWTKDVLIHHIENHSYEKYLLNQTNFDETVPEPYREQAKLAIKDQYIFDFMELSNEHSERELEQALISHVREFLSEMGGTFAFIGNQYHVKIDNENFYIDLLLFHRKLRCLVAIDLKVGTFIPEFAGKMQFYLAVLDELVKQPDENPSIGIIICKEKKRTIVEYALKNIEKPIGVASYQIRNTLPEGLKSLLPSPDEIKKRMELLEQVKN